MEEGRGGRNAFLGVAAAGCLLLLAVFFVGFKPAWTVLTRILQPAAVAALLSLASWTIGHLAYLGARKAFVRWARLAEKDSTPSPWIELLIGFPLYGTLCGILAWTGVAMALQIAVLTFALGLAGLLLMRNRARNGLELPRVSALQILLLLPPVVVAAIEAISPVTSPDELVYKLGVPHLYLEFGRMLDLPLNSNSYFSMSLGLTNLGALILSGGIAAKLVYFVIFLAALRAVWSMARRLHPGSETLSVAVVAWTPALMVSAGWCWVEWALIGLLLCSFEHWLRFRDRQDASSLAVASLALGGAVSLKYTALFWVIAFALVVVAGLRRKPMSSPIRALGVCAGTVLLVGSFFYLRNWVWTGSPVAPFLTSHAMKTADFRADSSVSTWVDWSGGRLVVRPSLLDDSLGVLLPLTVLLSPLALRRRKDETALFWVGAIQLVPLLSMGPVNRFFLNALVPMSLVGSSMLASAWMSAHRALKTGLGVLFGFALAGQFLLVSYVFVASHDLFPYLVGMENAEQQTMRTRSFAGVYTWIEHNTDPNSLILLIGENRVFDLDRRCLAGGNLDGPRMADYLAQWPTVQALSEGFKSQGITHVLVHPAWIRSGPQAEQPTAAVDLAHVVLLPESSKQTLESVFSSSASLIYRDADYLLYSLGPTH